MRISKLAPLLALAACSQEKAPDQPRAADGAPATASAEPTAEEARVPCARGQARLTPDCTVDSVQEQRGLTLTLRHPDGAFRKLLVTEDGRGVVAADGAEPARVTVLGPGEIEVAIGADRYRLPATVRAGG
jgi:hypothetical protein